MVVGAKVCDLTEDLLWFVCGLYVGILTSPLRGFTVPHYPCPFSLCQWHPDSRAGNGPVWPGGASGSQKQSGNIAIFWHVTKGSVVGLDGRHAERWMGVGSHVAWSHHVK